MYSNTSGVGKPSYVLPLFWKGAWVITWCLQHPKMTTIDGSWTIFVSVYGFVDYRPTLNSTLWHILLEWACDVIPTEIWTICHWANLPKSIISSEWRIPTKNNLFGKSISDFIEWQHLSSSCKYDASNGLSRLVNSRLSFISFHAGFFIRITCSNWISKSLWEIQI